jgi:manganese/zinc/iron transport system permease protein
MSMGGDGYAAETMRVLLLQDYNTRLVTLSAMALGGACGLVGAFMMLRKRALLGDAAAHAALPGLCAAFFIGVAAGLAEKSTPLLLLGAVATAAAGALFVVALSGRTRLKEDALLGIVLSVFFGLGVSLLGVAQQLPGAQASGLESFIYGKVASMVLQDAVWICVVSGVAVAACVLLYKEFTLLCFDPDFARGQGLNVRWLDAGLMTLVVTVACVGLQAVGLILVVAMLVIPPAAARFWTDRLKPMLAASAALGAASAGLGAMVSALAPKAPSGAVIVLCAAGFFVLSMMFGQSRGVLARWRQRRMFERDVHREHLLRAIYEWHEARGSAEPIAAPLDGLLGARSWGARGLKAAVQDAVRSGLAAALSGERVALTPAGVAEAKELVRRHRLWETYLIHHADVDPSHVDRPADDIEHVLGPEMTARLSEAVLGDTGAAPPMPPSPHSLGENKGNPPGPGGGP